MKNQMFAFLTLFIAASSFAPSIASAASIEASQSQMDFGVVVGAFAPKPTSLKVGKYDYSVIAPDFGEPACNSTQIIVWVNDNELEGDAGGIAYNLGRQVTGLISVTAQADQLKITYRVNDPSDCEKSHVRSVLVKYVGRGAPLRVK